MAGGDLFITGRIKDIIIRAGQHIAPHEIEEAVGTISGIRNTGVVAFGVADPTSGTERVVILAETDERDPSIQAALKVSAQGAATHIVGGPPDEVVLMQAGTVPKTASGKSGERQQGIFTYPRVSRCRSARSGGSLRA